MLTGEGSFLPFGGAILADGTLGAFGGQTDKEQPGAEDLFELLCGAFTVGRRDGKYLATAIACNVNISPEIASPHPDGIRMTVETTTDASLIYVPYSIQLAGLFTKTRTVQFAKPFTKTTTRTIAAASLNS